MHRYQVEVTDVPHDEVAFVAALRTVGRLSLPDATDLYAYPQQRPGAILVAGIRRTVAEHIVEVFRAAGFALAAVPSSIGSPMVLRPQSDAAYRWGPLRTIVEVVPPTEQ